MANFIYYRAKRAFLTGGIDFTTADMRVLLVMTNTNAHTTKTAATFADITTLDDFDGANYSAGGAALAGETVVNDDGNERAYFDATDLTFSSLGAGTRQCKAAILYKFSTNLAASQPVAYIDTGGFPFQGNGSNVTIVWNAAGIVQMN